MYYLIYGIWYTFSLLPWRIFYFLSDYVIFPLVYHVIGYRRKVVRSNIANSFPEKTDAEHAQIERDFYHWFSDCIVESIKQMSMSPADLERHMKVEGIVECERELHASDASMAVVFVGHYANWEWLTAAGLQLSSDTYVAQIYHPLHNKVLDRIIFGNRSKCGVFNLPMKATIATLRQKHADGIKSIAAFVSDQSPRVTSIRHRMPWLHQDTPVITGAEFIGGQVGALYYYAQVTPLRRGYYQTTVHRLHPVPDTPYPYTEAYMRALEADIKAHPHLWLWSHKRWKY